MQKYVEKIYLDGKKVGKAVRAIGSVLQDLHETHGEVERELDKGGADGGVEEKIKQKKRTESMLEECARPLANPSAASFFPLFLSNSVSLFLSSSPLSFSNH